MAARYSACDIAHWILAGIDRAAGDSITHLKLQKLLYYAQAWALCLLGRPLFEEDLQAWVHGPVAESVFRAYRRHGFEALPPPDSVPALAPEDEDHLRAVIDAYGDFSARRLEAMTHNEDPWRQARGDLAPDCASQAVIPKDHMKSFYTALYARSADAEERLAAANR
jgi:uncharacterized phage-associated protein